MSVELVPVEERAEKEMGGIIARAQSFLVKDEQSYMDADAIIAEVRAKVKALEPELAPAKETATRAWKAAVALWKKYIEDPLEACKTLDRKRYAWKRDEDRLREAEAEQLREEERKKAAEEKLALATRLESAGMKEQSDAVLNAPIAPASVPEPIQVEKPAGQAHIENWQARVVEASLVPRTFCMPDQVALNRYAKLMKSRASVAGVIFEDVGTVRRG